MKYGVSACKEALRLTGAEELFHSWMSIREEPCSCFLPLGELSSTRLPYERNRFCGRHGWDTDEWKIFFSGAIQDHADHARRAWSA